MNKKKVIITVISLTTIFLLILTGIAFSLVKKYQAYTKEALKDKYNNLIYQYLKPNRKILLLDFNTEKNFNAEFCPRYKKFSNWFISRDLSNQRTLSIPDKSVVNKKIFSLEKGGELTPKWELEYKDGLCHKLYDRTPVKGTETFYEYEYDTYNRLAGYKELYYYFDEINESFSRQYRYVFDYYSKTLFIFEFNKNEIWSVFYINKIKNGYKVDNYSQIIRNKEPSEDITFTNMTFEIQDGKLLKVTECDYFFGSLEVEIHINYSYSGGMLDSEEMTAKTKSNGKFHNVVKNEYTYTDKILSKIITTKYDKKDSAYKEISRDVACNFIYDSNGNEIYHDWSFEYFKNNLPAKDEGYVKTVITYK
ncbi:MAG: hypothetical protein ACI4LX_11885 [Treponema sp.]